MGSVAAGQQHESRIVILTTEKHDTSIALALSTLHANLPSSLPTVELDLSDVTDITEQDVVVVIGHGSPIGLKTKEKVIDWESFYENLSAAQPQKTFVLACNSPTQLENQIYGFNNQIDATAGALLLVKTVVTTLDFEPQSLGHFGEQFYQRVWDFQEKMKNPLGSYLCFIHGYNGKDSQFWEFEDELYYEYEKIGQNSFYQDVYYFDYFADYLGEDYVFDECKAERKQVHNDYTVSNFADNLKQYIINNVPADSQVDIVGHSLGGIIARELVRRSGGFLYSKSQLIGQVISVATPHYGTSGLLATGQWDTQVFRSVCFGSNFITSLNDGWLNYKDETNWHAVAAWDHGALAMSIAAAKFNGKPNDCIVPVYSALGHENDNKQLGFANEITIDFNTGFDGGAHDKVIEDSTNSWDSINDLLLGTLDTDGDGLYDYQEKSCQTDPSDMDSDGDTFTDYDEVQLFQTDPNDPNDYPSDFSDTSNYAYPLSFGNLYVEAMQVNDIDWVQFSSTNYDKLTLKVREVRLMTITVTLYSAQGGLTQRYQNTLSPGQTLSKQWDRAQNWGEDFYVKVEYVSGGSTDHSGSYQLEVELYIS